jgi:ribose transport system ATP-binding protein
VDVRDLTVRWGEIVGLSGLNGSGRTTFLKALFGDVPFSGEVEFDGRPLKPRRPADAIAQGVGLVPENRKTEGLILDAAIYRNAVLPSLRRRRLLNHRAEQGRAEPVLKSLSTQYTDLDRPVRTLSGGNQQKIVLAKWLIDGSRLLLLDEPSRGLDVGAKADLYGLVRRLADQGAAVIVASSELEELYAACDSIWVFYEGRNVRRFDPTTSARDDILKATILGERA